MKKYLNYLFICTGLFSSYLLLLIIWSLLINIQLVPWDATLIDARPPIGSISRTVNDFFETYEYAVIIDYSLIAISLTICIIRFIKNYKKNPMSVLAQTTITNSLYILSVIVVTILYNVFDNTIEIHYQIPLIFIHILLIVFLFYTQITNYSPKKD